MRHSRKSSKSAVRGGAHNIGKEMERLRGWLGFCAPFVGAFVVLNRCADGGVDRHFIHDAHHQRWRFGACPNHAGGKTVELSQSEVHRNRPVHHMENAMNTANQPQYPANLPSKTGNPSGGGRSNNTPKGK